MRQVELKPNEGKFQYLETVLIQHDRLKKRLAGDALLRIHTEFLISQTRYIVDVVNRAEFLKCSYFLYVFLTLSRKIHGFTLSNNVASDVVKVQRFKHRLNDV